MLVYSMSVSMDGFIEAMLVWETDPSMRDNPSRAEFATRLAEESLAEEVGAALDATGKAVSIGGAGLAAQAFELGLIDELRNPVVVGGRTPFLPPVTDTIAMDLIEARTFGSRVVYERYGRTA